MESELSTPPLRFRRQFLSIKFYLKLKSRLNDVSRSLITDLTNMIENNYWNGRRRPLILASHSMLKHEEVSSSYPLYMFTLDTWISNIDISDMIRCNLLYVKTAKSNYDASYLKYNTLNELREVYAGWHFLYTDGSKTNEGVGAAYYDPLRKMQGTYKINKHMSIMTAELIAIYEALKYILSLNINKIVICTDSKSGLQHISKCVLHGAEGLAIAYLIIKQIQAAKKFSKQIIMQWVPSHVGLLGNEEADKLAKTAIHLNVQNESYLPNASEILCKYKKACHLFWKEYFNERSKTKGIWYKTLQCEPPRVPWFLETNLSRSQIIVAHRLRSGHVPLNGFAYLMGKSNSPNSNICGKVEDVHHVLMECVRFAGRRAAIFSAAKISAMDVGAFNGVLANPASEVAKILYSFFINKEE